MSSPAGPEDDSPRRLRLYARRDPSGEVRGTFLIRDRSLLLLWEESGLAEEVALPLPEGALPAVFRRYGKPLAAEVTPALVEPADDDDQPLAVPLPAGGRARLWRFRFMPFGWVHPADYLLWEGEDGEPLAAPAPLVASALSALARAAAG